MVDNSIKPLQQVHSFIIIIIIIIIITIIIIIIIIQECSSVCWR